MNLKYKIFLALLILAAIVFFVFKYNKGDIDISKNASNVGEKADLIVVESPQPNQTISSPLQIKGMARGFWYFEASFPAELLDANGNQITIMPIQAEGEWMTTEFVPFNSTMTFPTPTTKTGTLILQKDNPSALPEHDDALIIPVIFSNYAPEKPVSTVKCEIGGCSRQVCAEEGSNIVTTCEYRAEYACYQNARCERQKNGQCGWTPTQALQACLMNPPVL